MLIAIASGKGGTGKTTLAVCLAHVLGRRGAPVTYVDCDVEEPNGHIFLNPTIESSLPVQVRIPEIDRELCTGCARCSEFCRFNALVCTGKEVLTLPDLCHGCGGCTLVCREGAVREVPHGIGTIETGRADSVGFVQGRLSVGAPLAGPVVQATREALTGDDLKIIDSPPGTSCPAVEAIRGADHVVLVTEPTPFGLNDLTLAVDMVRELRLEASVVVNRCDAGETGIDEYCEREALPVLARIPEDRDVARTYARGQLPCSVSRDFHAHVTAIAFDLVEHLVHHA